MTERSSAGRRFVAALLVLALCACRREPELQTEASAAPRPPEVPLLPKPNVESLSLLDRTDDCELFHRGITLDIGDPALESRRHFSPEPQGDLEWISREGARFARLRAPKLSYDVWIDEPQESIAVRARIRGAAARMLTVSIDDTRLGTVRVTPDATTTVELPAKEMALTRGRHRLTLALSGRSRAKSAGPINYGEVSWLSLTSKLPERRSDIPSTRTDALIDVVLGDRPRRSIALREHSSIHCPISVPKGAKLRLSLGLWGEGKGEAELVVARDEERPVSLGTYSLEGGQDWREVEVPLDPFEGQIVELELHSRKLSDGARMAFGEPRLERPARPPDTAKAAVAERAIVIVLAGLSRKHHPPESRASGLASLGRFSELSVSFSDYRTPTTVATSVLASFLTGLSPRAHTLEDPGAALPLTVPTLPGDLKAKSGRSAMFTAVPTSFADFGLSRGFDRFESVSPVEDRPATESLTSAESWLLGESEAEGPELVLVHLRGGHPPFDLAMDRARDLPPAEYGGDLEPRRAAIQLAQVRERAQPRLRQLLPDDRVRFDAMQRVALEKQDTALSRFLRVLEDKGLYDSSLIVIMGDVGAGEPPEVPFDPAGPLTEERVRTPLFIKWPHAEGAGRESTVPVTTVDLHVTLLAALGLETPKGTRGLDLRTLLDGPVPLARAPLQATLGASYATRSGEWLLRGEFGKVPTLCRISSDPACTTDLLERYPRTASALWQWTYRLEQEGRSRGLKPRRVELERATEAALTVWGDR